METTKSILRIRKPDIDSKLERRILTGLIVSDEFCSKILPIYKPEYLLCSWTNTIVQWIKDYWKKYGNKAPFTDIQTIWEKEKEKIPEEKGDLIMEFLQSISRDYEQENEGFNVEYELDRTFDYFRTTNLHYLNKKITECIRGKQPDQAERLINGFKPPVHPAFEDLKTYTLMELMEMDIEPINYLINGFLPMGLTLWAGKDKVGKSGLMLNLAIDLSIGRNVFNVFPVNPMKVLYLALEDPKERIINRTNFILGDDRITNKNLHIRTLEEGWPTLDKGGLTMFENWMEKHPDTKCIIIDVFAKIRKPQKTAGYFYQEDYNAIVGLQELAWKYNIAVIVVHHTRKTKANDIFDEVSGTTGIGAAVDTKIVTAFTDKNIDRVVYIRGRDVEEKTYGFQVNNNYRWIMAGDAIKFQASDQRQMIVDFLYFMDNPVSRQDILRVMENKIGAGIDVLIQKLVSDGSIKRIDRGIYAHGKYKDHSRIQKLMYAKAKELRKTRQEG